MHQKSKRSVGMRIKCFFILAVTIAFIVIHCNPVFSSQSVGETGGEYSANANELKSPQDIGNAPVIVLNEDDMKADPTDDSGPNQIGYARQIATLSDPQRFKQELNFRVIQDGGRTATIIISSPEAKALRVGIMVSKLPEEAEFRFFESNNQTDTVPATLITGRQINHLLQLNKNADPDHPYSRVYWSPTIDGENIGIEIYLPPWIHPDDFDIAIPFLSHLEVSPFVSNSKFLVPQKYGDSDSCQKDATCNASWQNVGNAVAKMVFIDSGNSYDCTGTLLKDKDETSTKPYFITANHCIGSQTVASTLETHWFFESDACDSSTRNSKYSVKTGGAALLWTGGMATMKFVNNQDVSFMELNDMPPEGATYADWSKVIDSSDATGIHHPKGDWKKISTGNANQTDQYICYTTAEGYSCDSSAQGSFFRVDWTNNGTETGSSGSGLFNDQGQLLGILSSGTGGSCEGSIGYYSKFMTAYTDGKLSQWLDPSSCTYSIAPSSGSFSSSGGTGTVSVTAGSSCEWTTSENLSWVSLSTDSGTGNQAITLTISPNTGSARDALITIAGQSYTITQAASTDQPISILTKTQVSQLYVSVFNRASEGEGNAYWQSQPDMATAANAMLATDAAKDYFGANLNTNQAFIEHIYLNTLNKTIADDSAGIDHWVGELNNGKSRGQVVAELVSVINNYAPGGLYYDPADTATVAAYNQFTNRVEVSIYMADTVLNTPENWQTVTSFSSGLIVTDDPATVITAKTAVDAL
jgi:Trypsin-like peptidase domain/Putative binding domain, N-terminal/Domain of unknown function (DUF4214)